jgi:hypothetical protein
VRSLSLVASLAALFVVANTVSSSAGSVQTVVVNMSHPSRATPIPQQADAVPPNCVRQECGKLWCWKMNSAHMAPTTNH